MAIINLLIFYINICKIGVLSHISIIHIRIYVSHWKAGYQRVSDVQLQLISVQGVGWIMLRTSPLDGYSESLQLELRVWKLA